MRNYSEMDFAVHYALRFGEIAIRKGFITRQQLREALEEQLSNKAYLKLRPRKLIGEILREHGYMKRAQIDLVLEEMKKNKRHNPKHSDVLSGGVNND